MQHSAALCCTLHVGDDMRKDRWTYPFEAIEEALYVKDRKGIWHVTDEGPGTLCGLVVEGEPEEGPRRPLCGGCVREEMRLIHRGSI